MGNDLIERQRKILLRKYHAATNEVERDAIVDQIREVNNHIAVEEYRTDLEKEEEVSNNKKKAPKPKEYILNGDNYFPNNVTERTVHLPPAAYECAVTMEGVPYLKPMEIVTDSIIDLEDTAAVEVTNEIRTFWSNSVSQKFAQYGLVQKRGILLHGPPGTGKTITLARCARMVIEELEGVVIFNPDPGMLKDFLRLIKDIEPTKKILVMWEEFDSILRSDESELLSLLDGETQVGNIVFLATTNYISKIPARIKNRPSRFARIIEVLKPSEEMREKFLRAKLHESDMDKLEALVRYSDDFVVDQIKDLIISVCCFGQEIAAAAKKINEMNDEAMGVDDFHEEQAQSIFKQQDKGKRVRSPLQPLS